MVLVKCNCMHATEIQWYIVVCYDKLSVQQCLCIDTTTELNLKGGFCRNPRNPSRSATAINNIIMHVDGGNQAIHWHSTITTKLCCDLATYSYSISLIKQ